MTEETNENEVSAKGENRGGTKKCPQCEKTKKLTQFYRRKATKDWSPLCRSCTQLNKLHGTPTKDASGAGWKPGQSGNPKGRAPGSIIERVCKRVFGKKIGGQELSGNESLLMELAMFAKNSTNKRDKKEILTWLATMMNPKPKETTVVEQKLTIESKVSEAIEDMICDLKVIDGGKR